jgi:hypothetical protein
MFMEGDFNPYDEVDPGGFNERKDLFEILIVRIKRKEICAVNV